MVKLRRKKLVKKVTPIQDVSVSVPSANGEPKSYERKRVLEILKMIKPGIASKDLVESMQYFFISGTEIVTYNDRISITHPFDSNFSAFVKAESFFNVMSKSSVESFMLAKDEGTVSVKAKGLNVKLPVVIDDEVISRIKNIGKDLVNVKWNVLPENFADCITLCSFAASKSESESTLSCVHIQGASCIASDNNRIASATLKKETQEMFIKASEIKNLISVAPIVYTISSAWLHFKNEAGCIFSIRRIKGDYPNFLPHFEFEGSRVDLPQDLTEGTDLASIFTSETEQPSISIKIVNNLCILSVLSESGGLDFETKIEYSGDPLKFTINPDFLLEMMKYSTSVVITEGKAKLETENFSLLTSLYEG